MVGGGAGGGGCKVDLTLSQWDSPKRFVGPFFGLKRLCKEILHLFFFIQKPKANTLCRRSAEKQRRFLFVLTTYLGSWRKKAKRKYLLTVLCARDRYLLFLLFFHLHMLASFLTFPCSLGSMLTIF
jgi:hypothetical protein